MIQIDRQMRYNRLLDEKQRFSEYDYVVVGAGASGAPIAMRLTENPDNYVLLLEAGGQQSVLSDIPGMAEVLIDNPEFDWRDPSVPQKYFTGGVMDTNNGKRLGGSSAINGMIYNRGNRRDFDNWVYSYGAQGWSYEEVLPYFMKSENNSDRLVLANNPGFHGTQGPLRVSSDPRPAPLLALWTQTLNELGIQSLDINGANQLGTTVAQSTAADGLRSSTANAYIDPNPHSDNLNILVYSFVTKILFAQSTHGPRAIGVEYLRDGIKHTVMARKEVILCAGVVRTPQLLMVSGIGPGHHLTSLGIPVIADLPVGDNLQDHPAVSIHMVLKNPRLGGPGPQLSIEQMYQLWTTRSGPLAYASDSITYINSQSNNQTDWPDLYFYTIVQNVLNLDSQVSEMWGNEQQLAEWREYFRPYLGQFLTMTAPHVYRVQSWGSIRLQSSDMLVPPLIDQGFLRHPNDRALLIENIRFMFKLLLHSSFSQYVQPLAKPIPGCQFCPHGSSPSLYECTEYIDCLIRQTGKSGWHLVGGARMGDPRRPDVVVDPRGRVKHVHGLRVCDSSIMPLLINANTYAASVMIGEKCADMIKQDNGHNQHNYL
ncbi:L-sorbose 1-dehydrogenase-like [Oppia nitens]|uniref:L-sorbose 1-dehydrogenase-like n=1 Tax=Oppia nitens TaxID=1686743 RepID=UPI0023DA67E0|nr:L-sorbose 1-dehydrogenase-like [Oppia nitens]